MTKGNKYKRKKYKEKIGQIIPTKDRPKKRRQLMDSIKSQSCQYDQIIIVDGSMDNPVESLLAEYPDLPITYVTQNPPGLVLQRNAGLKEVAPGITLVGFLDDDIVLEPGCIEAMYKFWETAGPEVGGAEYNIVYDSSSRNQSPTSKWIEKIFLISDDKRKGKILPSGLGVSPYPAEYTMRVSWLSGGCNVYRHQIFEKHKFDDWYIGWGIGDDLEFSCRVSKENKLFVVAGAHLKHLPLPTKPGRSYLCGMIITMNCFHFVYINPEFSRWWCAWANLGRALSHFYKGIASFNLNSVQRCIGHLVGIYKGLTNTIHPLARVVK